MLKRHGRALAGLTIFAAMSIPSTAYADAIDGHWCYKDGRRLTIDGPRITTPGGKKMTGEYDRHGFIYIVPKKEPGAGKKVTMQMLDEGTISLWTGPRSAKNAAQTWKRCGKPNA